MLVFWSQSDCQYFYLIYGYTFQRLILTQQKATVVHNLATDFELAETNRGTKMLTLDEYVISNRKCSELKRNFMEGYKNAVKLG